MTHKAMTYDVAATGERIELLLGALTDGGARTTAEELVREIVGLYGAGLERVMAIVTETGAAGTLRALVDDPLVSGLLVLHDLHPLTTAERVRAALDGHPHGRGAELLGVEDGVVRLRLEGPAAAPRHGRPSPSRSSAPSPGWPPR